MLEIRDLTAGYEFLQVLWGVSLEVSDGEFVVLIGPNGAGKTTILRAIAGIIRPTGGQVRLMNQDLHGLTADRICRLGVSFITEDLNLFTGMTVHENLLLGAYNVREAAKVRETLEFVYSIFPVLLERSRQFAGTLSGGERKMLGIGRSIMANPRVLLVDEPSLGLAPQASLAVFGALQELNRRGDTILLVEQNVNTSLHLTHRGYVLEQGRIVMAGQSGDLLTDQHVRQVYLGLAGAAA